MVTWPFMHCLNCGHGQTFHHRLVRRGRGLGVCDACGPNRSWIVSARTERIGMRSPKVKREELNQNKFGQTLI